jgi:small GTP-binding protein
MKKFKIITLGDSNSGKSTLVNRFKGAEFKDIIEPTIGVDFAAIYHKIKNKEYKAHIWDTAGLEIYHSIIASYYNFVDGVMLVYDVSNIKYFDFIIYWLNEFISRRKDNTDYIVYLIGNKTDLVPDFDKDDVKKIENIYDIKFRYYWISAKNDENVVYLIHNMINELELIYKDKPLTINFLTKKKKCCYIQ